MVSSLYILLAILPSSIWLLFYLRKDAHPEPKKTVLKIFFYGILFAVFALFLELNFQKKFLTLKNLSSLETTVYFILCVGFIEEISKYLTVRFGVLRNSELDEPIDLMIYMIIAALGFAALENFLVLFRQIPFQKTTDIFIIILARFLGATFLHTLASGILGYFLAMSFFNFKARRKLLAVGIVISTLLHGFYNFSIIVIEGAFTTKGGEIIILSRGIFLFSLFLLILLFLFSTIFLFKGFKKLKEIKSVCKLPKNVFLSKNKY